MDTIEVKWQEKLLEKNQEVDEALIDEAIELLSILAKNSKDYEKKTREIRTNIKQESLVILSWSSLIFLPALCALFSPEVFKDMSPLYVLIACSLPTLAWVFIAKEGIDWLVNSDSSEIYEEFEKKQLRAIKNSGFSTHGTYDDSVDITLRVVELVESLKSLFTPTDKNITLN